MKRVQKRTLRMIRGLELCYEEKMRQLGFFSLQKRRLQGDLMDTFQFLKGNYKKAGKGLFISECSDRLSCRSFNLKDSQNVLDSGKKFFLMRVVRHWNRLPRVAVDSPSLEMFKAGLDGALGSLIWWCLAVGNPACRRRVGTRWSLRSSPNQDIL